MNKTRVPLSEDVIYLTQEDGGLVVKRNGVWIVEIDSPKAQEFIDGQSGKGTP